MVNLSRTFESLRRSLDGRPVVTRFAPSPTGYLHLGHVASMIYVWGIARALGGRVLLRIEDHDRGRCREEYLQSLYEDLSWLGFVPDSPISHCSAGHSSQAVPMQSLCEARYQEAVRELAQRNLAYGCKCTRKQIAAAVAPDEELFYPGTCRDKGYDLTDNMGWRIRLGEGVEIFEDGFLGPLQQVPAEQCGDILARDRNNQWTYQFAVVLDDLAQDISLVVRGQDLTSSTGRQIALRRMFTETAPPVFAHHPLIVDPTGKKLSKRTAAQSITARRKAGETAEQILSEAAHFSGAVPAEGRQNNLTGPQPVKLDDILQYFYAQARK